jgi:hypothetical protein
MLVQMPENPWEEIVGNPIAAEGAWRLFEDWRSSAKEIGVLYCARGASASISAMLTVRSARNGVLRMKGDTAGAAFTLKEARFTYGPLQVFPRWPAPPPVEVMALQAYLVTGDWLVLAEGLVPRELSPLALPM